MNTPLETSKNSTPYVGVVYAGGTISSLATAAGYREGGHEVDLVGHLAQHRPNFDTEFSLPTPLTAYTGLSENIQPHNWAQIEDDVVMQLTRGVDGVVVTHGTDSMEQTARFLQRSLGTMLFASNHKVILTGANDDISVPGSDAWSNMGFSFDSILAPKPGGIYVAFHDRLIPADLVVKEPFDGTSMNYTSKNDPRYIAARAALLASTELEIAELEARFGTQYQDGVANYRVNRYRPNHQAILNRAERGHIGAALLTLYHSGTAHTEVPKLSVARLARTLWSQYTIPSFAVTENGEVANLGSYETSVQLAAAGIIPLSTASQEAALAKLRLTIADKNPDELISVMQQT